MIQQNDEQNYNINVFEPEPIELHKSIDVCSFTEGGSVMTNKNPFSPFRNSEKEGKKCKSPKNGLNRFTNE